MSRSRFGGFRTRKLFSVWEDRRSPSSSTTPVPETVQDFDYTTAQGIWNLRSTTQFSKKETTLTPLTYSFVASASSIDSSTITIPATTQEGDIAILVDSTATGSTAVPTGWTSILSLNNVFESTFSYKILGSGDSSTTVTGQTDTQYSVKIMLVFRPSDSISTVTISSLTNSGETSGIPSVQTINSSTEDPASIVIGMIRAYQAQPFMNETFWNDSVYVNEGNGNNVKVFYEIQTTNTQRTITTTADYGAYNFAAGFVVNAS
jgi:hypothetical protein